MTIGATVHELRQSKGLSRERLAVAADVSSSTIERLELEGRIPKLNLLRRIARALDVSVHELIPDDAPDEPAA